jgi:organic radical activating enzyme
MSIATPDPDFGRFQPTAIYPGEANKNSLHICWMLHNACNHRCSYCHEANWNGSHRWLTLAAVESFWSQVQRHYKGKRIHVSFTGGEPTVWPEFTRFCRILKEHGHDLGVTSNGGLQLKIWQESRDLFNWICLSYHPEYPKDDHLLEVIRILSPRTRLAIRIMMHKEEKFWHRSVDFGEKIRSLPEAAPVFVEYVPLQVNPGNWPAECRPVVYEDWQADFLTTHNHFSHGGASAEISAHLNSIRDVWDYAVEFENGQRTFCRPNDLVANNQVNFKDWSCHAGLELLFVDERGYIYRGNCKTGGKIGNILHKEIIFPTLPVLCPRRFCPCGTDIQVRKAKVAIRRV